MLYENVNKMIQSRVFFCRCVTFATFLPPLIGFYASYGFAKDGRKCSWGSMKSTVYLTTYKSIVSLVPLAIMIVSYALIFWILRNAGIKRIKVGPGGPKVSRRADRYQNRLSKISCFTCMVFMVFYLPNSIFAFANPQLGTIQNDFGSWIIIWLWIGQ